MRRVILSGGPGAGKTTLVSELSSRGYSTVSESARELIAERLARGDTPRPEPIAFARELLRQDKFKYAAVPAQASIVFFDRSPIESLAMVHEATPLSETHLQAELDQFVFHSAVFMLPPWQEIYSTVAERDHTFDHATQVHASLVRWYKSRGFSIHEVPRLSVAARADHVLHALLGDA
jgi:predicted ATPase